MPSFKSKRKLLFIFFLLILLILPLPYLFSHIFFSKNQSFQTLTNHLFETEITSSTLNLHYTLAHPEKFEIKDYPITFGTISTDDSLSKSSVDSPHTNTDSSERVTLENLKTALSTFSADRLSKKHAITLDILNLYIDTQLSQNSFSSLKEVLSPSLGIQAQLPVLMAEYTFRTRQDIEDYLNLLSTTDTYFQEILNFEEQKKKAGTFMGATAVDHIIAQCESFIDPYAENYLATVFNRKIKSFTNLSDDEKSQYMKRHNKIIELHVVPAYQLLINGMQKLRDTAANKNGLYYLAHGKDYYHHLIQDSTGVYDSIETIRKRLLTQLTTDYKSIRSLITKNPALVNQEDSSLQLTHSPKAMLNTLHTSMSAHFPALNHVSYDIKTVDDSLEHYLSPAFYLTPPLDDSDSNSIYINQSADMSGLELFTTLAHEGFPGHLYQTVYFNRTHPDRVRYLFSFGGYVEGWATYVESYAYLYSSVPKDYGEVMWLNRSMNLALCSLLDLGIHYYGWTIDQCTEFLENFGIKNKTSVSTLFQSIVENPANYLQYYLGYLSFLDLKKEVQKLQGKAFDLKKFHKIILETGPCQFPVLRKYVLLAYQ